MRFIDPLCTTFVKCTILQRKNVYCGSSIDKKIQCMFDFYSRLVSFTIPKTGHTCMQVSLSDNYRLVDIG